MPKQPSRARPGRAHAATPNSCLYLGCFYFDEPGTPGHVGTFQLVVEASDPEQAVERCRLRLRKLRTTTSHFDQPMTIFVEGIIKLTGSFKSGVLVNWESGEAPPPPQAQITCLVPEQNDHGVESYGVGPRLSETNGTVEPFLDFGGEAFRSALEAAQRREAPAAGPVAASAGAVRPASARHSRSSPPSDERPSTVAVGRRATRREGLDARKKRREALALTVAELREAKSARKASAQGTRTARPKR